MHIKRFCFPDADMSTPETFTKHYNLKNRKYTAKVGQDNVNIGFVTIFRLANLKKGGVGQPKC